MKADDTAEREQPVRWLDQEWDRECTPIGRELVDELSTDHDATDHDA